MQDILIRKHFAQAALPVDIDQIPVGAGAALENPDPEALLTQPRVPAAHPLGKIFAVLRLIAEESGGLQACQHRRALFDHHGLKITLHGRFSSVAWFKKSIPAVHPDYAELHS